MCFHVYVYNILLRSHSFESICSRIRCRHYNFSNDVSLLLLSSRRSFLVGCFVERGVCRKIFRFFPSFTCFVYFFTCWSRNPSRIFWSENRLFTAKTMITGQFSLFSNSPSPSLCASFVLFSLFLTQLFSQKMKVQRG